MINYEFQLSDILESARINLSTESPSEWCEANLIMGKPFAGRFSYSKTPYAREIVDRLSPNDPSKIIAIKKGAQIGISAGVIYPSCGWIIANSPANTVVTVGAPELMEKTMEKIDLMISGAGLRGMIKPSVERNRAGKSGDTNLKKEFIGGYISLLNANNHKSLRQIDLQYGFFDDFEAIKQTSKESGSTRKLLEQRFAAYYDKSKIFYISTPEVKGQSNIDEAYELGDKRKFMIPCPCCGSYISIEWAVDITNKENEKGGIAWKVDENNKLIPDSVGYICQECGDFFDDKEKDIWLNKGFWKATAEPSQDGYYSYQISALYAPHGMYDWKHYVLDWIQANPIDAPADQSLLKAFYNLVLGESYEDKAEEIKANQLQKNVRQYDINTIPQSMSIRDGNGRIMLLTCSIDLNGVVDDARADFEVCGHSENGSTYSILHGSIGTFIPREGNKKNKEDRYKWTYEHHKPNSVWPEIDKILSTIFQADDSTAMKVFYAGVDTGHYTEYAYYYIEGQRPCITLGLKGDGADKYLIHNADVPTFKKSVASSRLFLVQVNKVKDIVANQIRLRHDFNSGHDQQAGFMNFPTPSTGLYLYTNYFSHFESEQREVEANKTNGGISYRWKKKTSSSQNHFWDVRIYNHALRDIFSYQVCTELGLKSKTWTDYINEINKMNN